LIINSPVEYTGKNYLGKEHDWVKGYTGGSNEIGNKRTVIFLLGHQYKTSENTLHYSQK